MKTIYKLIVLTCTLALFASCSEPKLQVTGDPEKDLATYVQLLDKDAEAAEVFINDCAATYEQKIANDPELAVKFCTETGIDALAPSFGTAHGIYKAKPVLDLDRVKVISEKTGLPLVMHGGSGVSDEDYRIAIANGICKINYYSYMAKAGVSAVQAMLAEGDVTFFHDLALAAQKAMEENAKKAMKVFAGL